MVMAYSFCSWRCWYNYYCATAQTWSVQTSGTAKPLCNQFCNGVIVTAGDGKYSD